MAYGGTGIDITLPAAADLSSYQYRFMITDANGRGTIATAATDSIVGILQNKPTAQDQPATIRIFGISKLVGGAALAESDLVTSNAQGFGTAAAKTSVGVMVGAQCIAATGASADVGDVILRGFVI